MSKVIRFGDKSEDVKRLQELLNILLLPNPKLIVDGNFGLKTFAAVSRFQASNNLGIDGVVGPKTWYLLQRKREGQKTLVPPTNIAIDTSSEWMRIAKKELGQSEVAGTENNPRIIKYHSSTTLKAKSDEVPWCSSFVNWVLIQAKLIGTNSASASSWLTWGAATAFKNGAIAIIRNGKAFDTSLTRSGNHVGFIIKETPTHYFLLGGNQSNQVKVSSFPKTSWILSGYRWPK